MNSIREKDWKILRSLKDEKLALFCSEVLENLGKIIENKGEGSRKAYQDVWSILKCEDEKIGEMFDELKRSNAVQKLSAWRRYGLLRDDEVDRFSEETKASIVFLSEL